jgi:hypothetical protein
MFVGSTRSRLTFRHDAPARARGPESCGSAGAADAARLRGRARPGPGACCLYWEIPTRRVSRSCFLGWGARCHAPPLSWLSFRVGPGASGQQTGGWQRSGSPAFRRGTTAPPQGQGGGPLIILLYSFGSRPQCASMFVALVACPGSELALGTGTMPA